METFLGPFVMPLLLLGGIVLFCFCAIQIHGMKMLVPLSHLPFGFSIRKAAQIRHAILNKSILYEQFLKGKVSQINYFGFKLYRALFLYELRCVLDWFCATTSLTLYDWLKLEDIYSSMILVKCDAILNRDSYKLGQKQSKMIKFCSGICLFLILECIIWAPMLIYSSPSQSNFANPIRDVGIQIDVKAEGGKLTLLQTTYCEIYPYQSLEFFDKHYLDLLNVYDIQLICCHSDANNMWMVPLEAQQSYARSLNNKLQFIFTWLFTRERPKGKEVIKSESFVQQSAEKLKEVINGTERSIRLLNVYPRHLRVTIFDEVRHLERTDNFVSGDLFLSHENPSWWSFHDDNASDISECEGMNGPIAIVISEGTPEDIIGETSSKLSLWCLYIAFVLAVGRFMRFECSMKINNVNLSSCDRMIEICEDIYAARAKGELEVEEALYWNLVKIRYYLRYGYTE